MSQRIANIVNQIGASASAANESKSALKPSAVSAAGGAGIFAHVQLAPPNAIFHTKTAFLADPAKTKVLLGVGAYRTNEGKPLVLNVVRKAEAIIQKNQSLNKEYLGITGHPGFIKVAQKLLFGSDCKALNEGRIATAQSISGTGALRIGIDFLHEQFPFAKFYISAPTWGNHTTIIKAAGAQQAKYRYWDPKGRKLDIEGMLADLSAAPTGSIVVLHACAHNPTGVDPTKAQWKQIADVIKAKSHVPFFDSAYQGFATGSLDDDAYAIRYFAEQGFNFTVCQSFAKNLGLYGERIGSFSMVTSSKEQAKACLSQLALIIRHMYSNPPKHGALIVQTVLESPELYAEWKEELKGMSYRIIAMRKALRSELERLGTPGDWSHITSQIGMFSFTGLTVAQVELMAKKHHCYFLKNGRISMSGLNTSNIKYFAQAMDDAVRSVKN